MRHIRLDSDSLVDDVTSPNASQIVESRRGSTGDPISPHQEAGILGTPTEETPTVPAFNIALCMNATIQEELIHMIGGSADERDKIRSLLHTFTEAAHHLQTAIQQKCKLHCIATVNSNSSTVAMCVYSRLWTAALDSRRRGARFARDAMCDAFHVAREVANERIPGVSMICTRKRALPTSTPSAKNQRITATAGVKAAIWLPYDMERVPELAELDQHQLRVPNLVSLDPALFASIHRLAPNVLAKVYAKFFHALWDHAYKVLESNASLAFPLARKLQYIKLTPPWLRDEVTFVRGRSSGRGFPFTMRQLPTKNIIRERGNKQIGSAILTCWLTRCEPGADLLRSLLKAAGAKVSHSNNVASRRESPRAPDATTDLRIDAESAKRPSNIGHNTQNRSPAKSSS